jgi:hypothetical protein
VKLAGDPFRNLRDVRGLRSRFLIRGHFTGVDPVHDLFPVSHDLRRRVVDRQIVQPQIACVLLRVVATQAVCLQERLNLLLVASRRRRAGRAGEQHGGQQYEGLGPALHSQLCG